MHIIDVNTTNMINKINKERWIIVYKDVQKNGE